MRFQLAKVRLTSSNLLIPNERNLDPKWSIEPRNGVVSTVAEDSARPRRASELFVLQRAHRIDARRAIRGHEAGRERHEHEHDNRRG
jgi:hypothetical protein